MIYNLIGVSEGIKTSTLIKQTHLKNVLFVTIFRQKFFFGQSFSHLSVMVNMMYY